MAPPIQPINLPGSIAAWEREVAKQTDALVHIDRIPQLHSGSKLDRPEFLHLRVLWDITSARPGFPDVFQDPAEAMKNAKASLQSFPWYDSAVEDSHDFKKWLALALWKKSAVNIANRKDIPRKNEENKERYKGFYQDPFKLVVPEGPVSSRTRSAMREPSQIEPAQREPVQREPPHSRDSSTSQSAASDNYRPNANPRNPDEQIVNEALLRLLEGISLYDASSSVEWSSGRKTFSVQQGDAALGEEVVKVMTAATDGSLQRIPGPGVHPEDTTTYAILEAKPFRRIKHQVDIRMQEGAEMAAWISSQPRRGHYQKLNGVYRYVEPDCL